MSSDDEAPPPSSSATVKVGLGEILAGKYRIERMLGAGGMGLVVAATHLELEQPVAIKMLREEGLFDPSARARFAREARAAVRLKSQHVARVIDVGTLENGSPFLVMEFLEGCDLGRLIEDRGQLPIDEAVAYMLQVCEAVTEAHAIGIVHRDLKPRNVFVTTGVDGKALLKVLDFGISKIVRTTGSADDLALTKTTEVMGSPSYMAPEQMRASRDADERSDIWSLGVILYEMITARLPWEAKSLTELGAMVLRDAPPLMRELREDVPPDLEQIVFTCLEKEPSRRFASVEQLAHALQPHALDLAAGAADRITSVARTTRRPPQGPSLRDRPSSSSSRVMVSGGTSVSWGETEPIAARASLVPVLRSRSALIAAGGLLVIALGAGGYALTTRDTAASAQPPALPDDRGGIRPPAPQPSATETVAATPTVTIASAASATSPPAPATPLASISRRPPAPTAPATTTTTTTSAAPPAKKPDPHDMGSIGRK